MVQEYERAVIFRLGRLLPGGSRGPGERQRKTVIIVHLTKSLTLSLVGVTEDKFTSAKFILKVLGLKLPSLHLTTIKNIKKNF